MNGDFSLMLLFMPSVSFFNSAFISIFRYGFFGGLIGEKHVTQRWQVYPHLHRFNEFDLWNNIFYYKTL